MVVAEYLERQRLGRGPAQGRQEGRKEGTRHIAAAMLHHDPARDLAAHLIGLAEQELALPAN